MSSTFLRHNYIIDLPVLKRRTWSYRGGRAPILSYPLYAHRLTIAAHSALSAHLFPQHPTISHLFTLTKCLFHSFYAFPILLSFSILHVPRDHDLPLLSILSSALHHYRFTMLYVWLYLYDECTYVSTHDNDYILVLNMCKFIYSVL